MLSFNTGISTYYYTRSPKPEGRQFPKFKKELFDSIKEQEMLELWLGEYRSKPSPTVTSSSWYWTPEWNRRND